MNVLRTAIEVSHNRDEFLEIIQKWLDQLENDNTKLKMIWREGYSVYNDGRGELNIGFVVEKTKNE